jgi:hypothetical protein
MVGCMTASYRPYEPLDTLKSIGPDIWIADGPVVQWGYAGMRFPFPTRMTVVRLPNGSLWVHSPIRPDENLLAEIDALGPVGHLVSPNKIHHISMGAWSARYTAARVWASPGVRQRSQAKFTDDLEERPPAEWADVIDQRIARGSRALEEVIFFHKPSRVMILADMIENFEPGRIDKRWFRWLAGLTNVLAPNGMAPKDVQLTFLGRHAQLRPTVEWMLAWEPEKVIIAHGKWFEDNGAAELRRAFSWVRGIG